jgi:hypothetical protein
MATSDPVLHHMISEPEIDVGRGMRHAAMHHGKGFLAQLAEIWRLRFGQSRLSPKEYYYYRLYDDQAYSYEEKRRFLGRAGWDQVYRQCNALDWWAIAHDKLTFYALMKGQDLPLPENRALFHPFRRCGDLPVCRSTVDLAACLRERMVYPAFAKPVAGIRSVGVAGLRAFDAAADSLILHDGRSLRVEDYLREIAPYQADGYLFQEMLRPHAEIARLTGGRLTTARLIVGIEAEGPRLMHALWKIPVGAHPADNFWRPGNLLAALDVDLGTVQRVVSGFGPEQQVVDRHPDSGERLFDAALPDWSAAVAQCLKAAALLSGLRLQAWDVALTDRGPVLLEVNVGGDFNLPQLARGAGIMDEGFRAFVARAGQAFARHDRG